MSASDGVLLSVWPRRMSASSFSSETSRWWRRFSSMTRRRRHVLEKVADLVDVRTHSFRRRVAIAPGERGDHGFVPADGLEGMSLLFERELASLDQEVVQRRHDAHDDAIA